MSALDLIQKQPAVLVPSAFEVIRQSSRADWQTVQPTSLNERKWYTAGYELKDDYAITDPVSQLTPDAFRFWWSLGLADAKADRPRRAAWSKDEAPREPIEDGVPWLPIAGGAAASLGLLLWLLAGRKS